MLSYLLAFAIGVDPPTPPIPPKNPNEPTVDESAPPPSTSPSTSQGTASEAARKEAELKASIDAAESGKSNSVQEPPAPALAPEAKAEKKKPNERKTSSAPLPPQFGASALCDELRRQASLRRAEKSQLEADRKAIAEERDKLEQRAEEIERAREQLKVETLRLEGLLEQAAESGIGAALPKRPNPSSNDNLAALAKTMKSMRPAQAAALVGKMDVRLAAQVLRLMSARDSGAVLAQVKPELAAELANALANMPAPSGTRGRRP